LRALSLKGDEAASKARVRASKPVSIDAGWNHNIHYHPMVLGALGSGAAGHVLDVGCGEGILARELLRVAEHVTAIDLDPASIDLARQADNGSEIEYLVGDFLTHPFAPASFDAIVSVARRTTWTPARRSVGCASYSGPPERWPSSGSRAAASPLICLSTSPRSLSTSRTKHASVIGSTLRRRSGRHQWPTPTCAASPPKSFPGALPSPPPLALLARLDQAGARGVAVSDR